MGVARLMCLDLYDVVKASATKMGKCDPLWLKRRAFPGVEVREGGTKGPRVLLLHGLFGEVSNWDSVFPLLEGFCRPMALKFPILSGHVSEVKVKALVALTEYFLRSRELTDMVVCGNSLGGHVALRLTLVAPDLVKSLVLAGASGLYEHTADTLPVRPGYKFVREHMGRVFHNKEFVTEEAIENVVGMLASKKNVLNLIHAARSAKRDNLYHQLPSIGAPTLLLWGEDDFITSMDVARTFKDRIPNSELETISGCGHAPMIEHPVWFAERVESFLRGKSLL